MDDEKNGESAPALAWREHSRDVMFESHIFRLLASDRESPSGKRGRFFIADSPSWVMVLPVFAAPTGEDRFVLVRQYRHGCDCITLEFPGGIVEQGEDPALAAARELEEETGYGCSSVTHIGTTFPNPALMTNRCWIYLARDVVSDRNQSLDELEAIDVETARVDDVLAGRLPVFDHHAIMLSALEFYRRAEEPR